MRRVDRALGASRPPRAGRGRPAAGSAALIAALAAPGCGEPRKGSELERQLAAQLTASLGADALVSCESGAPRRCQASLAGSHVPLELSEDAQAVRWRIQGLVISGTELERQVVAQLAALGLEPTAPPRCGPALQIMIGDDRVLCRLGELGVAWATVAPDGSYSLELALGEAAAARSQAVDEALLDELSRALDREQGKDEAGEGPGSDDDVDDAAPGAVGGGAGEGDGAGPRPRRGVAGARGGAS